MVAQQDCTHHWIIDPPSGTQHSSGTCKHCRMTRDDFQNSVSFSEWFGFNKYRPNTDTLKATRRQKRQGTRPPRRGRDNRGRFAPGGKYS